MKWSYIAPYSWASAVVLSSPMMGNPYPRLSTIAGLIAAFGMWRSISLTTPNTSLFTRALQWIMLLSAVICITITSQKLLGTITASIDDFPLLATTMCAILQLFGTTAVCMSGTVYCDNQYEVLTMRASGEVIDVYFLVTYACVSFYLLVYKGASLRDLAIFGATLVGYSLLRPVVLLLLLASYRDIGLMTFPPPALLFYDGFYRCLSFIALPWLVSAFLGDWENRRRMAQVLFVLDKSLIAMASVAILAGTLIALTVWYDSPGIAKNGTILIDDYHSDFWEPADVELDEESFGGKPLYAYSEFVRLLRCRWHVSIHSDGPLTEEVLANYSVVVLKTPIKRYSRKEREALLEFVNKGGGVWIIGDHTDLLGMTTHLNELIQSTGQSFRCDSVNRLSNGYYYNFRPGCMGRHVILRDIEEFEFLTSCSIDRPLCTGMDVITGSDLLSDPVNYSGRSFFGTMLCSPSHRFGCLTLCSCAKIGDGRLVLFSDGTVFSNFCLHGSGHLEFATNAVDWLNRRRNHADKTTYILGGSAMLLLAVLSIAIWRCRSKWRASALITLPTICLGWLIGSILISEINTYCYGKVATSIGNRHPQVGFVLNGYPARLPPIIGMADSDPWTSFNSFLLSVWRVGFEPVVYSTAEQIDWDVDALVFINPQTEVTESLRQRLERFVLSGGSLIVLDGARNDNSSANELLSPFDMTISFHEYKIFGGNVIDVGNVDDIVLSEATHGDGSAIAGLDSGWFSDGKVGNAMSVPDEKQREYYRVFFNLWKESCKSKMSSSATD